MPLNIPFRSTNTVHYTEFAILVILIPNYPVDYLSPKWRIVRSVWSLERFLMETRLVLILHNICWKAPSHFPEVLPQ